MGSTARRSALLLAGATLTAGAIAVRESSAVSQALDFLGEGPPPFAEIVAANVAALVPAALVVTVVLTIARWVVAGAWRAARRYAASERRPLVTAGAPLAVLGAFVWLVATAHAAHSLLSRGEPLDAGIQLALATILLALSVGAVVLALAPLGARLVVRGAGDGAGLRFGPAVSTAVALAIVLGLLAYGITYGEPSGARGVLGIFGVLRRSELDLRPVGHALVLVTGAWTTGAGLWHFSERASSWRRPLWVGSAVLVLAAGALFVRAGTRLTKAPGLAAAIRQRAPLAGLSLGALHRAIDRDHDGYAAWFGGGDCDDHDPAINPAAIDVPGNGVDEDCSGLDTPAVPLEERSSPPPELHPDRPYNVLLITIDALRADLGFAGHPRAISPRLDALAAKGTIFEHAYAMASMTWQSLGSLLIGKYPSEIGGYERFNHFTPENVLVTERLHAAGVRTFAAVCQFAFSKPNPKDIDRSDFAHIGHGFDVWDTSADPNPNGYDYEDDAITSEKLTNAAISLMSKPENVASPGGRFFAWLHYFDPHTQYVLHPEAPDFSTGDTSDVARDRARYESEVWFADHHVGRLLDFIADQPWGNDTAVIVTGDHGEAFDEHGMRWHRKELWEELIHVPLLVYVPGQEPRRVSGRRSHVDLARTILDLTGVASPKADMRGVSLLPDVLAPPGGAEPSRTIYAEIVPSEGPIRRALITGPGRGLKLVHRPGSAYELYDLEADPGEAKNLAATSSRLRAEVDRLQRFRATLKVVPWSGRPK